MSELVECDECGGLFPKDKLDVDEDGNTACEECLSFLEQEEDARAAELDAMLEYEAEEAWDEHQ